MQAYDTSMTADGSKRKTEIVSVSIGRELNRENLYWLEKSYDTDFELGKIANEGNGKKIRLEPSHQRSSKKQRNSGLRKLASSTSKLSWMV